MKFVTCIFLGLIITTVQAQHLTIDTDFDLSFNGPVTNIIRDDTTLYVSGQFTGVGLLRPYSALLNSQGLGSRRWPKFDGAVDAIIPDGQNGWYIAGMFDKVGDSVRHGLVRINADFSVAAFNSKWTKGIRTLTLKDGKLYAGGMFTTVGGTADLGYTVMNINSGTVGANHPDVSGAVSTVTRDNAGGFYLSGVFAQAGDSSRNNIAHIDVNKHVTSFNPDLSGGAASVVIPWNDQVIIGGFFTAVNGVSCPNLAIVDRSTGKSTQRAYNVNGSVETAFVVNDILYIGGEFTAVDGLSRSRLAAINLQTGVVEPLNVSFNGSIYTIEIVGNVLYAGGQFTSVNATGRSNLAAINLTTGNLTAWNPAANARVEKMKWHVNALYIAGQFTVAGAQTRNFLAAISSAGTVTSWNPNANDHVLDLDIKDNILFSTGRFTTIGNQRRQYFAAIDLVTGVPADISCNVNDIGKAVAIVADEVVIAGNFVAVKTNVRNYFAVFDSETGSVLSEQAHLNSIVTGIQVTDNRIFIGGNFTSCNEVPVKYLIALERSTLNLNWTPDLNANIFSLSMSASTLYAGGVFTTVGVETRRYAAAFDVTSLQLTDWNPDFNNAVATMLTLPDEILTGGYFTQTGGQVRTRVASIKLDGTLNPSIADIDGAVSAILLANDTLYIGGEFTSVNNSARQNIASIVRQSASLSAWNPTASSRVQTLGHSPSGTIAGGIFSYIGLMPRTGIASINITTKQPNTWAPNVNGAIDDITVNQDGVYIAGAFTQVNETAKGYVAALDKSTGQLLSFDARTNGRVNAMELIKGKLYLAGNFQQINEQHRRYAGAVDAATGNILPFDPAPNGIPQVLSAFGDTLFIGGAFSTIAGTPKSNMAAFDYAEDQLLPWSVPEFTHTVTVKIQSVKVQDDGLIVAGSFSKVGDLIRKNLVKVNRATGEVMPFNPNANIDVYSVDADQDFVYSGGRFINIGGSPRTYLGVLNHTTGLATPWKYYLDGFVNKVFVYDKYMFVSGTFVRIEGDYRNGFAAFKFNEKPKLTASATQLTLCEGGEIDVPFEVYDDFLNSVVVEVTSSNSDVLTDDQITLVGAGAHRKLHIDSDGPVGSTQIHLLVTDNILQTHEITILVEILAIPASGSISGQILLPESQNQTVLSVVGAEGSVIRWESSADSVNWQPIPNSNASLPVTLQTDSLYYRVVLSNGFCEYFTQPVLLQLIREKWNVFVYPIPVSQGDSVFIKLVGINRGPTLVEIVDARGSIIYQRTVNPETKFMALDTTGFSPGFYLVRVSNGSRHRVAKVIML